MHIYLVYESSRRRVERNQDGMDLEGIWLCRTLTLGNPYNFICAGDYGAPKSCRHVVAKEAELGVLEEQHIFAGSNSAARHPLTHILQDPLYFRRLKGRG